MIFILLNSKQKTKIDGQNFVIWHRDILWYEYQQPLCETIGDHLS